jgi:hypothetical protein
MSPNAGPPSAASLPPQAATAIHALAERARCPTQYPNFIEQFVAAEDHRDQGVLAKFTSTQSRRAAAIVEHRWREMTELWRVWTGSP